MARIPCLHGGRRARAPKFRNAKAASLRICFVPSRHTFSPQYGFRFDYARNRALDPLYALTRIACIETVHAFHVAAETRYVASAQISATVKILLQKSD
jgi:hypothetical protein